MPPASSTTMAEPSSASNRRQPVRQTRAQPAKYGNSGARGLGGRASLGGEDQEQPQTNPPRFLPGVTYFTDSITALPKEMSRHFTMLKEVDAKIYHPEDSLKRLLEEMGRAKSPVPFREAARLIDLQSQANTGVNSAAVSVNGAASVPMVPNISQMSIISQATSVDDYDIPRRKEFWKMRLLMTDMLPILEEKNHVIATATDTLAKQLARCESSWSQIENEISEETRLGNRNHWAYTDRTAEKKDGRSERPRREAAANRGDFAAIADDFGATRGTGKRRAQQAQIESEIEETRANKRAFGAGKSKKPNANQAVAVGLGLSSAVTNPTKKRKTEDTASIGGVEMLAQKSISNVFSKGAAGKGASSPRSRSPAPGKRPRAAGNGLGVNGKGRARAGTGASAANSPLVSSPAIGTFSNSQKPNASPAVGAPAMGRTASSRGRQNSTQNPPPAPSSHPKQINGVSKNAEEGSPAPSKATIGRNPRADGPSDELSDSRSTVKREESGSRHRPPSVLIGTRTSGKASKTATPVLASFPEMATAQSRPRSNRAAGTSEPSSKSAGAASPALGAPPKRSHKKGAGMAAQQAALRAAQANDSQSAGEGEGEGENEEGERRYCYCNGVSYGDMVGCDGDGCEREWFHLDCIGLERVPAGKAKWYCKDCRRRLNIS